MIPPQKGKQRMNKARRNKLQELIEQLETIKEELEMVQEEEQEAYDNLPESLQSSAADRARHRGAESCPLLQHQVRQHSRHYNDFWIRQEAKQ